MIGTDGWIAQIVQFKDTHIGDLNTSHLEMIYKCLTSIESTLSNSNKMLSTDQSMNEVARNLFNDNMGHEGKKPW